ncbi:MAG: hypothetical protein EOO88_43195, partial [Pedobacter sp.]
MLLLIKDFRTLKTAIPRNNTFLDRLMISHSIFIRYKFEPIEKTIKKTAKRKKAATEPAPWLAHLRSVFLLGVPNEGSYLEQNGLLVERLLRRINLFPTRFLSEAIARRSNGIKDLGQALLVDEDWQQPDDPALPRPRTPVPLLPGVRYHVLVGDWL